MNFLKNSISGTESNTVPDAHSPQFQNAQAVEEHQTSPVSPAFDTGARRSSDNQGNVKWDMFDTQRIIGNDEIPIPQRERRMSKEWDASKVPPSQFQKRKGSIHATPASRDGHIDRNKLTAFVEKHTSDGKKERRKSQS